MNTPFIPLTGRRAVRTIFAICSMAILFAPSASAHTLKTDGTISASLHLQPDDDPISSKPTEYVLFLNDSTRRFSFSNCDCTVAVTRDGKTVSTESMQLNTQHIVGGSITFAQPGAYEIIFEGAPKSSSTFQPFTLRYAEQVAANTDTGRPSTAFVFGMSAIVVSMSIIALFIKIRYNSLEGVKK